MDKEELNEHRVAEGVFGFRTAIANIAIVGGCGDSRDEWVIVDAGVPFSGPFIKRCAERVMGKGKKPIAIVLTHGHFDHVGGLKYLLNQWDIPVYAHKEELPFLTGEKNYLPPDPSVGMGLMSLLSPLYPRKAINLGERVQALPENGTIPEMPDWRYIHTPGHTLGHISLFRDTDKMIIVGDAFITVKQESALAVLNQTKEIHGPPAYFTPDWETAEVSIRKLHALQPRIALTGHGKPMAGSELIAGINKLVEEYDHLVVPKHGRYVH